MEIAARIYEKPADAENTIIKNQIHTSAFKDKPRSLQDNHA